MATIYDRVVGVIKEHFSLVDRGQGLDEINRDTRFKEDLGADSLDTVELAMGLEDEFLITVQDDDIETVGDAVRVVEGRMS